MSVPVYKLCSEGNNTYGLKLVGGKSGLSRDVSWAQVMEDKGYGSFLLKNELIFTTGVGKSGDDGWLKSFIETLIRSGSSGIVVNIGKYIARDDIGDEIIELCDSHQFPIFTMPWNVRLTDVLQSFLYAIFASKEKEFEITSAYKQLFLGQNAEEGIARLKLNDVDEHKPYQVVLMCLEDAGSSEELNLSLTSYKFALNKSRVPYAVFPLKKCVALVLQVESRKKSQELVRRLHDHVTRCGHRDFRVGMGMIVPSLRRLSVSYDQALYAVSWACSRHIPMQYFGGLGVYAVLFSQQNRLAIRELHDDCLADILKYDEERQGNLFQTLESYLKNDGSIQAVARETYVHRNTVAYRIRKIKQILQCDVTSQELRFTYMLACHIHHYFSFMEKEYGGIAP